MPAEQQWLRGPAQAAVLKVLEHDSLSGYQLLCRIRVACPEALKQGNASLQAVVHYLEAHRWIVGSWLAEAGVSRRVYSITDHGRKRLAGEERSWKALAPLLQTCTIVESDQRTA